jgi:hypothetical protein
VVALASMAAAEHPGRYLESRRAAAPVVYLATVTAVRELPGEMPGATPGMEATLKMGRIFRPEAPPSPAPTESIVRYEQAGIDPPAGVFYKLQAGERALVFAESFDKAFPLEMITGAPKSIAVQVAALRAFVSSMDDVTASLHGVTPAIRARQVALYDRILAELGSPRTP